VLAETEKSEVLKAGKTSNHQGNQAQAQQGFNNNSIATYSGGVPRQRVACRGKGIFKYITAKKFSNCNYI